MAQNPQKWPKRAQKGVKNATEGKSGFRQQNHLLLKEAQKCYDFEKWSSKVMARPQNTSKNVKKQRF